MQKKMIPEIFKKSKKLWILKILKRVKYLLIVSKINYFIYFKFKHIKLESDNESDGENLAQNKNLIKKSNSLLDDFVDDKNPLIVLLLYIYL